ncbi:MAG TPA: hypothetical protein VGF60_07970 [Xanthobacteraceae bacterium]|jgi:hypothetical protein
MAGRKSTLPIQIPTTFNVSALAREHNISRSTVRRRLARGWVPPASAPADPAPQAAPSAKPGNAKPAAVVLVGIGLLIGALALAINAQFGWRFGTSTVASMTFASLSLAADALALGLPAVAVALWHGHRPMLAACAWVTWTIAATLATLASLGFIELHTGDAAARRQALLATSSMLMKQHEDAIAAAQLAATTAVKGREAECVVRGPRCRDREGDERLAMAALNNVLAASVPAVAAIGAADPQVSASLRLASWAGLKVHADDVLNLRLALMAMLPNMAGVLLTFAMALSQPRPARSSHPGPSIRSL